MLSLIPILFDVSINFKWLFEKIFGDKTPKKVKTIFDKMYKASFPGGLSQIDEEAEMLHVVLKQRVSIENLKQILAATKPLFITQNLIDTQSLTLVSDVLFQQRAPGISRNDIQTINEFYVSYFNLRGRSCASLALPLIAGETGGLNDLLVEAESIEVILERDGVFWGVVSIQGSDVVIKNANIEFGFVSAVLHIVVAGARKNLTIDDKLAICKWSELPSDEWTGLHYSTLAFAFTKWISVPNPIISRSEHLLRIQKMVNKDFDVPWVFREFDEDVEKVFQMLFSNPNQNFDCQ